MVPIIVDMVKRVLLTYNIKIKQNDPQICTLKLKERSNKFKIWIFKY